MWLGRDRISRHAFHVTLSGLPERQFKCDMIYYSVILYISLALLHTILNFILHAILGCTDFDILYMLVRKRLSGACVIMFTYEPRHEKTCLCNMK